MDRRQTYGEHQSVAYANFYRGKYFIPSVKFLLDFFIKEIDYPCEARAGL